MILFDICYTTKQGKRITAQKHTGDKLSDIVAWLEKWDCKNIIIKQVKSK